MHDCAHFVTPGVAPMLHAFDRFKLLIMLLFPVLGKPAKQQNNMINEKTN